MTMLLVQPPVVYADKETVQEKALTALRDVAGIDVNKYTINVTSYSASPTPGYEERYRGEEAIRITFESKESQMSVIAECLNNRLSIMYLYITAVSSSDIHYVNKLSNDPLIATREVLSRLQKFSGNAVISDMQRIVDQAKTLDDIAGKTFGNIKCVVHKDTSMSFIGDETAPVSGVYFMYTFNGGGSESPKSI
jgi:hypothetical protein